MERLPGILDDYEDSIRHCGRCITRKTPTNIRAPLVSINSTQPLELVYVDFLTFETSKGGYQHILIITYHFTRYAQAIWNMVLNNEHLLGVNFIPVSRILWNTSLWRCSLYVSDGVSHGIWRRRQQKNQSEHNTIYLYILIKQLLFHVYNYYISMTR